MESVGSTQHAPARGVNFTTIEVKRLLRFAKTQRFFRDFNKEIRADAIPFFSPLSLSLSFSFRIIVTRRRKIKIKREREREQGVCVRDKWPRECVHARRCDDARNR